MAERIRGGVGRYWPDGGVASRAFRARFPDESQLVEMARMTARGRVRFWHPWHMERTTVPERIGRRIVWSAAPNGDREWPHALARCSHLVDLAAGHVMTGEPELLDAWIDHVDQLARARASLPASGKPGLRGRFRVLLRPYERELWRNDLDASLRVVNVIRSYDLVKDAPALPARAHVQAIRTVIEDLEALHSGLGTREGNWEVFKPAAILLAAVYLRGWTETSEWERRARGRLREVLAREIGPDGIMVEQVPMYQGVCALALLDALLAFPANGLEPDRPSSEAAVRLIEALSRLADPRGRIPTIGDSDAFEVEYLEGFARAVLGEGVVPEAPPGAPSGGGRQAEASVTVMPSAGWAIARWRGSSGGPAWVLLDASGRPPATHAGHSHADDLQLLVHAGADSLLVDPGRFTYASGFRPHLPLVGAALAPRGRFGPLSRILFPRFRDPNERDWRAHFRATLAHNTVAWNGRDRPGYASPAEEPSSVRLIDATADEDVFRLVGRAEWSVGSSTGPTLVHERTIVGLMPDLLVVVDRLEAPSPATWIASFHLGEGVRAGVSGRVVDLRSDSGSARAMAFEIAGEGDLDLAVEDDWVSPTYNERRRALAVRARIRGAERTSLVTALTLGPRTSGDVASVSSPSVEIRRAEISGSPVVDLQIGEPENLLRAIVNPRGAKLRFGGVDSRALVCARRTQAGGDTFTAVEDRGEPGSAPRGPGSSGPSIVRMRLR